MNPNILFSSISGIVFGYLDKKYLGISFFFSISSTEKAYWAETSNSPKWKKWKEEKTEIK